MRNGTRGLPFLISINLLIVILLVTGAYIVFRLSSPLEPEPVINPTMPAEPSTRPMPRNRGSAAVVETARMVVPRRLAPTTVASERPLVSVPTPALAAPTVGRGIVGVPIRTAHAPMRPVDLRVVKNINLEDSEAEVYGIVVGGERAMEPLPRGEPGGRIMGRSKDIRAVFRLVRIEHDLSDWWADQSSLVALTQWLTNQTRIRTDMGVQGGAIRLTDAKLFKAPLVFLTGHDPAMVRKRGLGRGPIKKEFTEQEISAMRRYLVEDGGFIYLDDCGVDAPAESFTRLMLAQLRRAVPEYNVDRIPMIMRYTITTTTWVARLWDSTFSGGEHILPDAISWKA